MEVINNAEWRSKSGSTSTALLVKLQILLDRAHASPGQIDATRGENTKKAVVAYREMQGLPGGEKIDEQLWRTLTKNDQQPALVTYTITDKDTEGPFIEKVPTDFREKASLTRLSYTSVQEALAEKFHTSEKLLRDLNPKATFDNAGSEILVPNVQREELPRKIARVEVSASEQRVRAYGEA
jgi:peptidoglycan hydrolase-like protein with peptidoglycan-binding domain